MKALLALLSPNEEATLRRIGFGSQEPLNEAHMRRLLQLELIEWSGHAWRLTRLGQRRYRSLVVDPVSLRVA